MKFKLGDPPSFNYNPTWSPDSKRIAYQDKRLNFWYLDLDTGKSTKVDTAPYDDDPPTAPAWSPDGRWLAHARSLKNYMYAVFLHSLDGHYDWLEQVLRSRPDWGYRRSAY